MTAARMRARGVLVRELPFVLVLIVVASGFCYTGLRSQHWLRGVIVVGVGFALAGILRLVLPDARAGLLRVRGRVFDCLCYLVLAACVIGFGIVQPR